MEPGPAGWEARKLLLSYADPPNVPKKFVDWLCLIQHEVPSRHGQALTESF